MEGQEPELPQELVKQRVIGILDSFGKMLNANAELDISLKSLPFQVLISNMKDDHILGQFTNKDPNEMTNYELHRIMAVLDEICYYFTDEVERIQDDITPEEYQLTVTFQEDWGLCDIPSD
jgi:hypothetical protein